MSAVLETHDVTRKTAPRFVQTEAGLTPGNLPAARQLSQERIAYLEGLLSQAKTAAAVFTQFTQEDVDRIVKAIVLAGQEHALRLAQLAI